MTSSAVPPAPPASSAPRGPALHAADLRGLARLAVDATVGVTDAVETLHAAIAGLAPPIGTAASTRTAGITGFVYRRVRGTARGVGTALDAALRLLPAAGPQTGRSARREAWVAALNGVWGDHLAATGNPLAIATALRVDGAPPGAPVPGGRRVLVLVHGLCMNDLQWRRNGHDHGERLALDAGWTVARLHYNSGRRVADGALELDRLLEALVRRPAGPPEEIAILAHSMGGLVARGALRTAEAQGRAWPSRLRALVCLGTPHLGAPLERGGHTLERLLGASPYSAAFARLGAARSAGIVDLRHGELGDPGGPGAPTAPRARRGDVGSSRTYAIAARLRTREGRAPAGDGLVPVDSALGRHADPARALGLPASRTAVIAGANHWDLLDHPEVRVHLARWLG